MNHELKETSASSASDIPICGIIMPISSLGECSEEHWSDVREILSEAIEDAGFSPQMVSDADDIGIIQKRIIQNIYSNPIVVCDVSGKNPNVMFELGMRLAFDKPTIIVKDDQTTYSFDTSPIEHLEYPRDLRFGKIVDFQAKLADKIQGTYKKATTDETFTPFLKHFGTFSVPVLETKEISKEDFILEELKNLRSIVTRISVPADVKRSEDQIVRKRPLRSLCLKACTDEQLAGVTSKLQESGYFSNPEFAKKGSSHYHINIEHLTEDERAELLRIVRELYREARFVPAR